MLYTVAHSFHAEDEKPQSTEYFEYEKYAEIHELATIYLTKIT